MIRNWLILLMIMARVVVFDAEISTAEEPEKTEKVVVTGVGINSDKARQNAIRNAVEQVVGTYVSSDSMIQNSQLIKDEILSFSGGYVKESKVLSTEKDDDLVKVQLEALVVSTKLKRKINGLNISVKKVEGNNLFSEAFSKIEADRSSKDLLNSIAQKYPQSAYIIDIGKPEIQSVNKDNNTAEIKVPISISWDKQFVEELKSTLLTTSLQKLKGFIMDNKLYDYRGEGEITSCFTNLTLIRSGLADCYINKYDYTKKISLFSNGLANPDEFILNVNFKASNGEIRVATRYSFNYDNSYLNLNSHLSQDGFYYNDKRYEIQFMVKSSRFDPPNLLILSSGNAIAIVEDAITRFDVVLQVEADKLSDVADLEVSMSSFAK